MTTVNESNESNTSPEPQPEPAHEPTPSEVLAAMAKRISELEEKLVLAKSAKRGKSEDDVELLEKHRKAIMKVLKGAGLDVDASLKGWIKIKTPGNPARHPSISVSKTGEEVYFMGKHFWGELEGIERIGSVEAKARHIGYARGELSLEKDITEVLKLAAEMLKSYKVEQGSDDDE